MARGAGGRGAGRDESRPYGWGRCAQGLGGSYGMVVGCRRWVVGPSDVSTMNTAAVGRRGPTRWGALRENWENGGLATIVWVGLKCPWEELV